MWLQLVELQPQTGGDSGGISREEFIAKIAADIQSKLPAVYDVNGIRKKMGLEITPTSIVLLQELDRFNMLTKKMATSLVNLQRVFPVIFFFLLCFVWDSPYKVSNFFLFHLLKTFLQETFTCLCTHICVHLLHLLYVYTYM